MATLTRADEISQLRKKVETYSDFQNNLQRHPLNSQLVTIRNEECVKQALKNLILTDIGERLFEPTFGSSIKKSLFENHMPFMIEEITRHISIAVKNFEPRIELLNIEVFDRSALNAVEVSITFSLINKPDPINISLFLKRVR